jgi:hypothetical protein
VLGGNAALLAGPDANEDGWLPGVPGLESSSLLEPGLRLVWTVPGRVFAGALLGTHGPRCRAQVAVVTGGHPAVASLAASLRATRPRAADWPVTAACLLGIKLEHATGRSLA